MRNRNQQAILRDLRRAADSANRGGYDNYERPDNFEAVADFLVVKGGYTRREAENIANEARNKPALANQIAATMQSGSKPRLRNIQTTGNMPGSEVAAQMKVIVTRPTAAINQVLPFAIFGALDAENGYRAALTGQLGAGTALTSFDVGESDGQPTAGVFTFTNGANVDTVVVECSTSPYPSVLRSSQTDIFEMSKIRVRLSDKTRAAQFDQGLFPTVRNMWGYNRQNNLTPGDFFSPEQFQEGVIDVDVDVSIDKETFLQSGIIALAGFSVSYSLSVQVFEAWRAGHN
jgi:hypothetical protein